MTLVKEVKSEADVTHPHKSVWIGLIGALYALNGVLLIILVLKQFSIPSLLVGLLGGVYIGAGVGLYKRIKLAYYAILIITSLEIIMGLNSLFDVTKGLTIDLIKSIWFMIILIANKKEF